MASYDHWQLMDRLNSLLVVVAKKRKRLSRGFGISSSKGYSDRHNERAKERVGKTSLFESWRICDESRRIGNQVNILRDCIIRIDCSERLSRAVWNDWIEVCLVRKPKLDFFLIKIWWRTNGGDSLRKTIGVCLIEIFHIVRIRSIKDERRWKSFFRRRKSEREFSIFENVFDYKVWSNTNRLKKKIMTY